MSDWKPPQIPTVNLEGLPRFTPMKFDIGAIEAMAQFSKAIAKFQADFVKSIPPIFGTLAAIFAEAKKADAAMEAGWVPFAGMPLDSYQVDTPRNEIHELLDGFTLEEWAVIRDRLSQSVRTSGVDDEAVATFEEALVAHEAGLYRAVVRLLFPEIERVARETVYQGSRRELPKDRRSKGTLNAGLKDFREVVMHQLPAGVVANRKFGLSLGQKMYEHLYKWVGEDDASLEEFRRDPVPNRHASQHGYVIYSTRQHSMNTLAMTDFMFHLIMQTNAYIERHSEAEDQPDSETSRPA